MPRVTYDAVDGVALVTLNRPEKRNAVDPQMAAELEAAIDRYESDLAVRVAVLRAEMQLGHFVFCAGHDLDHFREAFGTPDEEAVTTQGGGFAGLTRKARSKPLIAAVDGLATSGGFEMVLACDIVVASERAAFAIAESKWNLVATGGGGFRLPRAVGRQVAMDMILTAEPITADRAYQLGLVSRLVPAGEADGAAIGMARRIASNGPRAVVLNRRIVEETALLEESEAWKMLDQAHAELRTSDDLQEGLTAFAEHRAPKWSGS